MERPQSILSDQARQNRDTSHSWMLYQSHRRELEKLLVPDRAGKTLGVLGAGNCNDLDLTILLEAYAEVHLVDLDHAALRDAAARQGVHDSNRLKLHAPIDLTGAGNQVEAWASPPTHAQLLYYIETLKQAKTPLPGPLDVVLSPCVLSQLINPARKIIGASHSLFDALARAHRQRHLALMTQCLNPGGKGILAIDLISSDRFPRLPMVAHEELPDAMKKVVAEQLHYPGLDPHSMRSALNELSINRIETTPPGSGGFPRKEASWLMASRFANRIGGAIQQSFGFFLPFPRANPKMLQERP